MSKKLLNVLSTVLLFVLFIVTSLLLLPAIGIVDVTSEPKVHGPENTTGVPEVTSSVHPAINGSELEILIQREVNDRRTAAGKEPFVHSKRVQLIARIHSKDMAEREFFDHTNPDDEGSRERHESYDGCDDTNENIAKWESVPESNTTNIAERIVDGWADSEGHNTSMMTSYDKVAAVGVYVTKEKDLYVTQNFCREHPNA